MKNVIDSACNTVFVVMTVFLLLASCTTGQRKDARTALQALDLVCDAIEVTQVNGAASVACELTDDARDAAEQVLKPKKKKRKTPKAMASAEPADGGAP